MSIERSIVICERNRTSILLEDRDPKVGRVSWIKNYGSVKKFHIIFFNYRTGIVILWKICN